MNGGARQCMKRPGQALTYAHQEIGDNRERLIAAALKILAKIRLKCNGGGWRYREARGSPLCGAIGGAAGARRARNRRVLCAAANLADDAREVAPETSCAASSHLCQFRRLCIVGVG